MSVTENGSFIEKSEEIVNIGFSDDSKIIRHALGLTPTEASIIIQRAWRRYIDMQVFKYYKDLLEFHNSGDPLLFMRSINPNEARLFDSASGLHIKFRLAGDKFPPTIYYKVFTHLPIQDLGANAPRDYTKPCYKKKNALLNNNRNNLFPEDDLQGWYKRIENNGWRPVSTKYLEQVNAELYFCSKDNPRNKPVEFKHTKLLRKQDMDVKRKRTKIEWMKKMYKEGMLKTNTSDKETNLILEEAAKTLINTLDNGGLNNIDDWEVDELLEWTNTLNYDDYLQGWKTLGTTAYTDKLLVERIKLKYGIEYERENTLTDTDSPDMSLQATFPTDTPNRNSSQMSGEANHSRPTPN